MIYACVADGDGVLPEKSEERPASVAIGKKLELRLMPIYFDYTYWRLSTPVKMMSDVENYEQRRFCALSASLAPFPTRRVTGCRCRGCREMPVRLL